MDKTVEQKETPGSAVDPQTAAPSQEPQLLTFAQVQAFLRAQRAAGIAPATVHSRPKPRARASKI